VVYYIHSDHLGSVSLVTDHVSEAVARQLYHPYGTVRHAEGILPTDYTFTGQRNEASIGLMHYGARFYSPRLGRFVSADSIVPNPLSPQDLNRYSYASNNPLRYRDPTGHQNWDAVNEYFMGVVYQIGANNWGAMGVSSVAAVRAGAEEVAREHSDSMAFEVGRLCGSLGTALQGLGEIEGGLAAAEAGVAVSGTGVGALVGVPVAGAGVAVAGHGSVLVGKSVGQAALSAGRLIQMASGKGGGSGGDSHKVYVVKDPDTGEVIYVGRTKRDLGVRGKEHNREIGRENWKLELVKDDLSYDEARYWEQKLIDQYGGPEDLENKIRAVAPENWQILVDMFEK